MKEKRRRLTYQMLKEKGYTGYYTEEGTERILQFGAGNFLRAFADYFIDCMNEKENFQSKVVVVQATSGGKGVQLAEQDGLYQVYLKGMENGMPVTKNRLISCISRTIDAREHFDQVLETAHNPDMRFIISNTTEAGIVYDENCKLEDRVPRTFPAKLTKLLFERYRAFSDAKGYFILSCELIDDNGTKLLECVLRHAEDWKLGQGFCEWLTTENLFCTTLVDRIVTGYPKEEAETYVEENGWEDTALVVGELFGFWAIAGSEQLKKEFPAEDAGLPVVITDNVAYYKKRKVRILNGAHTSMATVSFLAGENYVRESTENPLIREYLNQLIYHEIIPSLGMDPSDMSRFADEVIDRFRNPYVKHRLLDITLNSVAKWKARVLPTLLEAVEKGGNFPEALTLSFTGLLSFYSAAVRMENGRLYGMYQDQLYEIRDDKEVLDFFAERINKPVDAAYLRDFAGKYGFFGYDLTGIDGFAKQVLKDCEIIKEKGMQILLEQKYGTALA